MFSIVKSAAASLIVAATALSALPAAAQDGIYLNFGGRHDGVGVYDGDVDRGDSR